MIELMIAVAIIGLLAAISIANFIGFQKRAKRAEVAANLHALYKTQKGYYAEKDAYSLSLQRIGFSPERGNRYAYKQTINCSKAIRRSTATEVRDDDYTCVETDTFAFPASVGGVAIPPCAVEGDVGVGNNGYFIACAAANIDSDNEVDSWTISSRDRVSGNSSAEACASGANPAGQPCVDASDL